MGLSGGFADHPVPALASLSIALASSPAEVVLITGRGWRLDPSFSEGAAAGLFSIVLKPAPQKAVDTMLDQAQGLPLKASVAVYQKAQKQILSEYPWVPLFYPVQYDFVNPRITGFDHHPVWGFIYQNWKTKGDSADRLVLERVPEPRR